MAEVGYTVTAKMPTRYHDSGEIAVEYQPSIMGEGIPDVGHAYDLAKGIITRGTAGHGLPAGTEVRIIYVWPSARESAVSINWIKPKEES